MRKSAAKKRERLGCTGRKTATQTRTASHRQGEGSQQPSRACNSVKSFPDRLRGQREVYGRHRRRFVPEEVRGSVVHPEADALVGSKEPCSRVSRVALAPPRRAPATKGADAAQGPMANKRETTWIGVLFPPRRPMCESGKSIEITTAERSRSD